MISADMTVGRLLEEHPELIEVLAGYHVHFKQLRNRLLRRVMAPRVTVAQAARIAGVSPDELLSVLRRAAGEGPPHPALSPEERGTVTPSLVHGEGGGAGGRPPALADVSETRQVHLDVRGDIRRGEEPFARIMAAVKALSPDQVLVLRAPFEPIPLYDVLGKRGLAHWTEQRATDDWSVWFYHSGAPISESSLGAASSSGHQVLDVRGLEPPQPMARVLEMIDRLGPGARLEVHHDRRPIFLYPLLDDRGFRHATDEPEPGLVRIVIWKDD